MELYTLDGNDTDVLYILVLLAGHHQYKHSGLVIKLIHSMAQIIIA